ncbi:hypothetical protein EV356DRAFT_507725 [Viridothelium virens]|uniref:DUF8035 domain-containing protein n=1 Tax=Viridothelium virens TaxID=1048519 RepID=A0A6A6H0L3_VIRVR|nr:hypothetical protein EV356DRAFT_507725 [Viridothelium virens]
MDEDRSTNYPGDYRDPSFDPPNLSGDYGSRNWPPPSPYAVSYPAASSYYNDWNHYPPQPTYRWSAEPNSAGNLRYPYDRGHGPRSRSTDSSMPHINIYRDSSEDAWLSRYRHGYEETPFRSSRDRNRPGSHYEEGLDELPRRSRSRNHVDTYNIPPPAHSRTRSPSPPVAMHNRYYNAGLNPEANAWGSGLHRSYSHGYAPAPQVNIYQDIAQDALQRTDPSIPEWSSSDDNYGEMTRNAKREESQSSDRRKKRMKPRSYPGTDERESIVIRPTHSRASRSPSSMGYYQTPYRPYRSPQVRGQSRDPDNEYYRSPYGRSPARRNSRSRSADNLEKYPSRGARPGSYRESEWALVPYTRNNPVTLSPVSEASAGGFEERTESESDIRKASGLEHVAQLTPNDNETILKALQEYTTFKNRATEASSTSVKEDLVSKERPGKRGKTKAPKRLMNKDILREYGSVSEEGDHYILDKALEKEQIDEIIRRSKEVQRTIGSPEITYSFGEATSTSGRQGSSYKESGGSNARTEANDNGSIIEQAKDPGIDAEYALGRIVVDNSDSASVGPDDSVSRVNRLRSRSRDDSESNAEVAEQTRPKYLVEKPEWTPLAKEWTSQGSLRKKKKGRKKQAKFVDGPPLDDQSEPDVVVKETISEPDRRQTKRRVKGRKAEVDEDSTRLSPPLGEDHDTAADAEGQESRSLSRQDENERRGRHDEQDKEFFAPVPPPPPPPDWFEEQRSNLHRIASPSGQSRSRAATVEDFDE